MTGPSEAASSRPLLRLGVTGHRLNRLAPDRRAGIEDGIRQLLARVGAAAARAGGNRSPASSPPRLRILSALAEGADRLAVLAAPSGWELAAVLPMPVAEYERDFAAPWVAGEPEPPPEAQRLAEGSLAEFRRLLAGAAEVTELPVLSRGVHPDGHDRDAQYAELGRYLVCHSDLILAVWDGLPAHGPGGTATVVEEASGRGLPVLHLDPARPGEPDLIHGFVGGDLARPRRARATGAALTATLRRIQRSEVPG